MPNDDGCFVVLWIVSLVRQTKVNARKRKAEVPPAHICITNPIRPDALVRFRGQTSLGASFQSRSMQAR